jgi:peptidoglycan/xylan/chitin deacetylase (PgdA/CDA1 family)
MVIRQKINRLIKWALGHAEYYTHGFAYGPQECLVLCMHSTPHAWIKRFEKTVAWLEQHFTIIGPKEFDAFNAGQLQNGPYLMFTFDDGLRNNYEVAHMLAARGHAAYFFVVPEFIESADQRSYYLTHIRPVIDARFEKQPIDFEAMHLHELQQLSTEGHRIGCHSMSHRLHHAMSFEETYREIVASKAWLEKALSIQVDSFCSPNNTNFSVNRMGKEAIAGHYAYHFSTFPGLQSFPLDRGLIFRRNIEVNWSRGAICFALGKWDLNRWQTAIDEYRALN